MYHRADPSEPLTQGDIIDACPLLVWQTVLNGPPQASEFTGKIVVLTQACDLAQPKSSRAVVALMHDATKLVAAGLLKSKTVHDQVRLHRVFGWYFLPAGEWLEESIVDLRDVHTLPRAILEDLIRGGHRLCQIQSPYREHLAQHFAITYSRIGLPQPYETKEN